MILKFMQHTEDGDNDSNSDKNSATLYQKCITTWHETSACDAGTQGAALGKTSVSLTLKAAHRGHALASTAHYTAVLHE